MKRAVIIGTGSYVPETVVSNEFFEKVGSSDEWIRSKLGIAERRISKGEATSVLAAKAAIKALHSARMNPDEIDLIILATATPDRPAPATSCSIQQIIGAHRAAAFDIAAVCSGALFAIATGCQFIESGMYRNVLVIGADTFSNITDWSRKDSVFFGDGAGAIVLSLTDENRGFLKFDLHTDGSGKDGFTIPGGGSENPASEETLKNGQHFFQMDGRAVFEAATTVLPQTINTILKSCDLKINQIRFLVPHQPSIRILQKTADIIGLPWSKVKTNMDRYANTSGGTIPIMLDETMKEEKLENDDILLFAAVGAGWTWGSAIYKV